MGCYGRRSFALVALVAAAMYFSIALASDTRVSFGDTDTAGMESLEDAVDVYHPQAKVERKEKRRTRITFAGIVDGHANTETRPKNKVGFRDDQVTSEPRRSMRSVGFGGIADGDVKAKTRTVGFGGFGVDKVTSEPRRSMRSVGFEGIDGDVKAKTRTVGFGDVNGEDADMKREGARVMSPGAGKFPMSHQLLENINYHLLRANYPGELDLLYNENEALRNYDRKGVKFRDDFPIVGKDGKVMRNVLNAAANLLTDQEVYVSGAVGSILGERKVIIDIVTVSCYDGQGDLAWAASAKKALDTLLASRYSGGVEVRVIVFSGSQFGAGMPSPVLRQKCAEYPDVATLDEGIRKLNDNISRIMNSIRARDVKVMIDKEYHDMLHIFSQEQDGNRVDITRFILDGDDQAALEESLKKVHYDVDEDGYIIFPVDAEGLMFPRFADPKEANACLKTTARWGAAKVSEFFDGEASIFDEFTYMERQLDGMDKADVMVFNFLDMTSDGSKRKHELVNMLFSRIGLSTANTITLLVGESGYGGRYIENSSRLSSHSAVVKSGAIAVGGLEKYAMGIQLSDTSTGELASLGKGILGGYLSEMHSYYFAYAKSNLSRKQVVEMIVGIEQDTREGGEAVSKAIFFPAARGGSDESGMNECNDMMSAISMALDKIRPGGVTVQCRNFNGKSEITDCGCWTSAEGEECLPVEAGLNLDVVCSVGLPGPEFNTAMEMSLPLVTVTGEGSVATAISYGKVIVYDLRSHKVDFWKSYASIMAFVNENLVGPLSNMQKLTMIDGITCAVVGEDSGKEVGAGLPFCLDRFTNFYREQRPALVQTVAKLKEYLPVRLDQNKRLAARIETLILQQMWTPEFSKDMPIVVGDDIYDFIPSNCGTSDSLMESLTQLRIALEGFTKPAVRDQKLYDEVMVRRADWLERSRRGSIPESSSDAGDDPSASDIWPSLEPRAAGDFSFDDVMDAVDRVRDGVKVPLRLLSPEYPEDDGFDIAGDRSLRKPTQVTFGDEPPKSSLKTGVATRKGGVKFVEPESNRGGFRQVK